MTAETVARALGGRKIGQGWTARCPAHDDRQPSLSIRNGKRRVLVRCHAGCEQRDVIAALKERGLWEGAARLPLRHVPRRKVVEQQPNQQQEKRSIAALAIWQSSKSAQRTPVELYLASRGIYLPPPDALRFHAGLKHPSGGLWPAMVALVTRGVDGVPIAIHRTFLARDGGGKAPVEPAKMMLGPCRGGVVRLAEPERRADGRRRDRDLPGRDAGDGTRRLGGAFNLGPSGARSAARRSRRDRARRW